MEIPAKFTFVVPVLQWFTNLSGEKICSFTQLHDAFSQQFSSSKKLTKVSDDLYKIIHAPKRKPQELCDQVKPRNGGHLK